MLDAIVRCPSHSSHLMLTVSSCSIPCFKEHKITHSDSAPTPTAAPEPDLPNPPPPKPLPKYLRSRIDFSKLATNEKYKDLLKRYPTLLSTLQRIYAATIEPDPEQEWRRQRAFQNWRGRGRGGRGRGSDRGGGPKWTQKKGDADALRDLKRIRERDNGDEEMEGVGEFVRLVGELFGEKESVRENVGGGDAMDAL